MELSPDNLYTDDLKDSNSAEFNKLKTTVLNRATLLLASQTITGLDVTQFYKNIKEAEKVGTSFGVIARFVMFMR